MKKQSEIRNLMIYFSVLLSFILNSFMAFDAYANNQGVREIDAFKIRDEEQIRLDGQLNESFWQHAVPATGFLQQDPQEGEPATEKTEVFIVYSRSQIYIGAILYDSDWKGILAYKKQRDSDLSTDDRFRWILDTFQDGRTGYFFEINPAGAMGDGLLGKGIGFEPNKSWDGIWNAKVIRNDKGWSAEISIPFRTLNFHPAQDSWRINFQRTIRRKNEEAFWSGHRRNQGLYQTIHAGRLTGLQGISQGIGLEVTPYLSAAWNSIPNTEDPDDYPKDIGFDLQYSLTPGLRTALTVNTDFAEVEVDQRRINLTRFPLLFPERRDFFLEGSSVHDFSVRSSPYPYFSRRIGLSDDGEPVPITFGLRLGGQVGRNELGFLQIRTGRYSELSSEDFTVARIKRGFFEQSSIGAIYTRRAAIGVEDPLKSVDRHTVGFDLDLKSSHFLGDKNFQFEAFLVWHSDPQNGGFTNFGDFSSRGIRFNFPNDVWRIHTSYREFGVAYDPAVGFTRRIGIRRINPGVYYLPRPANISFIRQFEFGINHMTIVDITTSHLETQWTDYTLLGIRFESGDTFKLKWRRNFERLDKVFEIHQGVILPVGDYQAVNWTWNLSSASHRVLASRLSFTHGEFWSGHRKRYVIDLAFRPFSGISLMAQFEKNDVDLLKGDFSTHLTRLIGEWHVNPKLSMLGNLQYDDLSDTVGLFARLRWIIRPGSDLYLVYSHNWYYSEESRERSNFLTLSRAGTVKVNYTYRF